MSPNCLGESESESETFGGSAMQPTIPLHPTPDQSAVFCAVLCCAVLTIISLATGQDQAQHIALVTSLFVVNVSFK